MSVAAGRPASPVSGTQISYYSQPITLTLTTGVTTGNAQPVTTVEVATDSAFTMNVMTKNVSQGSSGLTVTLDHLNPSTTYYWRVKTSAADNAGAASTPSSFTVGPLLVIQPPVPVQPPPNSFQHKRPTFTVTNAGHTGPTPTLTYRFEIASDQGFSNVVASGAVAEGQSQTSFTPTSDLVSGAMFYWRVQATDTTTGVASGYSTPQGFTTVNPDDGTYRYVLTLHLVSATNCKDWGGIPVSPPRLRDVAFDSGLVVSGDHLRYTDSSYDPYGPVELDIQRTGNQLSATLSGRVDWPGKFYFFIEVWAKLSGTADNTTGSLTGTGNGSIGDIGFPSNYSCDAVIAFTLTPNR